MQAILVVLLLVVVTSSYAILELGLPGALKFVPEMLTGLVAAYVIFAGAKERFAHVQPKYWIVFGALALTVVCGLLANSVSSGPTISGLRYFFRAIPFFFLPAVFNFSDRQIKHQVVMLLALCFMQIPLAIFQRIEVLNAGGASGDTVMGTLEESGALSLFLICSMLVCVGFYLKKRISQFQCIAISFLILIPTTINETKASFFFIPVGLLTVALLAAERGKRLRIVGWVAASLVAAGSIAIPVYDYMQQNNPYPQEISLSLLTDSKKNYSEVEGAGVGATSYVGRKDALTIPIEFLSDDPVWLAFGLGIGNASDSSIGANFTGQYGHLFKMVAISDASQFMLERGFVGLALYFLICFLVFRDAIVVARRDPGIRGALAAGWVGVVVVAIMAAFYKTTQVWASAAFLFWYFSGLIAARRMQLIVEADAARTKQPIFELKAHPAR